MAEEKLTAATRLEKILDNIAGGDNEITPATRLEKFLSYIADAMEGGGGSGGGVVPAPSVSEAGKTLRVNNAGQLEYVEDPIIVNMLPLPDDFEYPIDFDSGYYLDVLPNNITGKNVILHYNGNLGGLDFDIYSPYNVNIIPSLDVLEKILNAETFINNINTVFNIRFNGEQFQTIIDGVSYNGYYILFGERGEVQ